MEAVVGATLVVLDDLESGFDAFGESAFGVGLLSLVVGALEVGAAEVVGAVLLSSLDSSLAFFASAA